MSSKTVKTLRVLVIVILALLAVQEVMLGGARNRSHPGGLAAAEGSPRRGV